MKRSSTDPWNWLVPDLKTIDIRPPAAWPYSAGMPVVYTFTSSKASCVVETGRRCRRCSVPGSLPLTPSTV